MIRFLFFVGLFAAAHAASADQDWNWHETSDWPLKFPTCSENRNFRQSPVDLSNDRIYYDASVTLDFDSSYHTSYRAVLKNVKDETVKFEFQLYDRPTVRAPVYGVMTEYRLHSGHFHWGLPGNPYQSAGSEHTVNGVRYTAELHLVHYKSFYPSINDAIKAGNDSLLVIGVFIEMTHESTWGNDGMKALLGQFKYIRISDSNATLYDVSPKNLLPDDPSLYHYQGGLTTPTCDGIVQWYVYKSPVKMEYDTVYDALWSTYQSPQNSSYGLLGNNFRPVQDLGTRMIATNFHTGETTWPVQSAPGTGLGLLALVTGLLTARLL